MKKILYTVLALAIAAFTLQSCEDVPMPYNTPVAAGGSGSGGSSATPAGTGTQTDPYNVAAANKVAAALQQSSTSASYLSDEVYIKGKVSSITDTELSSYGNITYYISDDGTTTNQLEVYRGFSFNGAKFTALTDIKVGDEVVIIGKLQNWLGTYEVTSGSELYSLNGEKGGNTPTPTGTNLLTNGDFETWESSLPTNWKSTSSAGNATLSQSTEHHGGSYSVSVATGNTSNKRMAYKELTLKAGTYTFSVYAKGTASPSQTEVGYVPVTDGTPGSYSYGGYVSLSTNDWTQVSQTFTLTAQTTICLVVMNPKGSTYSTAQDILIDDASLTTSDGGIEEGDTPTPTPSGSYTQDFTTGQGSWVIQDVKCESPLTYVWKQTSNYGMVASAYASSASHAAESWLVSPAFTVSNTTMTINNALNKLNGGTLDDYIGVYISTNYTSGLPSTATWTKLTITNAPSGSAWTFVDSSVDLSAYSGQKVTVAFKYVSTTSIAPTWEIKSVK